MYDVSVQRPTSVYLAMLAQLTVTVRYKQTGYNAQIISLVCGKLLTKVWCDIKDLRVYYGDCKYR